MGKIQRNGLQGFLLTKLKKALFKPSCRSRMETGKFDVPSQSGIVINLLKLFL